mgnify:CR=1 FL=1
MNSLAQSIHEFTPKEGNWLPLEELLGEAFSTDNPREYYHAIFTLFERYPEEDGSGVFWTGLHGMEHFGGYEDLLLQYYQRKPNDMTRAMLVRLKNSGEDTIGNTSISALIEA